MRASLFVVAVLALVGLSGCVFYLNPQCDDLIRNGEETDIDCGGTCGPCNIGDRCNATADCYQSTCEDGRCTPLPCDNGVKDVEETDVDCGGPECRKCSGGRTCEVASDCFSDNCVAGTNRCFGLSNVTFADQMPYDSGSKTYAIFSGDLDGDGDIDIAAANEQDSNISVFINNGMHSGVFTRQGPYGTGVYPTGGALGFFNDDMVLDLVTADYRGDSVSVLLGGGAGVLGPKTTYPTVGASETSNLAIGDLNNDGNLDIVATNPLASSVSQLMGRPDGTFDDAINVPVGILNASGPYSAAIGDFDRNGTADLAIADVKSATIVVRLGNGDGTFQDEVPYLVRGLPPFIMITRDLDLDTNLDLVVANRGSHDVSVLMGRGDGTFNRSILADTRTEGKPMTGPYSVAVADFNQDGVPDVITANFQGSNASLLLGIGNGKFEDAIDTGPTGVITYGITAADFNNDGKPDFATANANTNNVTVKLNNSTP